MINVFSRFISAGHSRSVAIKRNIFYSLIIKGGSIIISLMLIPMTIRFVNETQYGLWLTLSSIVGWFNFFDIGLGNGLKTRLTESIAKGDLNQGKVYVSTTYAILIMISVVICILFFVFQFFIDWSVVLNAPSEYAGELWLVATVVFMSFLCQFVLNLVVVVAAANQNTVYSSLINLSGNLLSFISIFILTKYYVSGNLLQLSIPVCLSPIIAMGLFTVILYSKKYKTVSPSFSSIDFGCVKDIIGLGMKFFIIQFGVILYYNVDNMIITQVLGPKEVTTYNIAYKYFAVITMISAIVMTPLWAAFADANVKKDYNWIRKTVKNLNYLCVGLAILSVAMVLASPLVYRYWVGDRIEVPLALSAILAVYTVWNTYRTIYIYYLNGMGVIRLQVYLVIISGLINIPLAIFLSKRIGVSGAILSTTILCILCGVIEIIQYKKLITNKAMGIWRK